MSEGLKVWVLDTSCLIRSKRIISIRDQWEAFKNFETMVEEGRIAMPPEVINEITNTEHPDLPGAWASAMRGKLQHRISPDNQYMERVMAVASGVVDRSKPREDADPYVLALALRLQADGFLAYVVAEDYVDRHRLSLATACNRLDIALVRTDEFLEHCGIPATSDAG